MNLCRVTMAQNLAFVGLSYSSPIVAIGMGCLIPSISFVLAVICRFASFSTLVSNTKFEWLHAYFCVLKPLMCMHALSKQLLHTCIFLIIL
ncbi:hypothetical protein Hdeb2414_s0033g00718071 [Helianthus debilis subsp. tardiflorus]